MNGVNDGFNFVLVGSITGTTELSHAGFTLSFLVSVCVDDCDDDDDDLEGVIRCGGRDNLDGILNMDFVGVFCPGWSGSVFVGVLVNI